MESPAKNASLAESEAGQGVHLDTTTHSEGPASRNAGFIRQNEMSHGPLPDKSGVPVVVSRCTRKQATAPCTHLMPRKPIRVRIPVSPSPQPSPLGRGSAVAHRFGDCEVPGSSNDGKWFSLSPRADLYPHVRRLDTAAGAFRIQASSSNHQAPEKLQIP